MAAGDVTIQGTSGRKLGRNLILVFGSVTLDGANPTPINLDGYCDAVLVGGVSLQQTSAPGDDPSWLSCNPSGATLNVYAWKNTGGTDPTLVASTNNTAEIAFWALCRR